MSIRNVVAAVAACALATPAVAAIQTRVIEYRQGETVLQGFVAWDDAAKGRRPGVLIVHEWWGHNEHAREQARRVAREGYVGFALDMYGKGKVTTHPKDAKAFVAEATKDPGVLSARFDAALAQLEAQPQVDPEKIAVFGYCFGGGVALNMARAGRDLDAVVTFHGALEPWGAPARPGKVKPAILVQTGGADAHVPPEAVRAFEKEMQEAGAQAKVITYPGAKHAFTNPDADKVGSENLAYDPKADRESFDAARAFLKQVFGR
ncbi:MAG TPA: dienelactone hydrolase family protein [Anaeromyxobacteraceae bacterium]|nr:dienelactone hydrolase family protein [Anaeromyxobacteraceae bacterium]